LLQIAVGGSYYPDVYAVGSTVSETFELLFLQDSQQLGLQCQRNIANLIQKERSLVGELEAPDFLRGRSGKSLCSAKIRGPIFLCVQSSSRFSLNRCL